MEKNQQGFTLVELIVGIAILTLIMSGTYVILASSVKSYTYNIEQGKNIQDSRRIFNEITAGIKNATAISLTNSKTLNYSIANGAGTDHYIISLDADTIKLEQKLEESTVLVKSWASGQVDGLNFTLENVFNGSKKKVQVVIDLTLKKSNGSQSTTVMTLNDIP